MHYGFLSLSKKKILAINDEYFVFLFSAVFYFTLYFNLNNKTLLGLFFLFLFIFWRKLKSIASALFVIYLLFLPFAKGKSFDFILIPAGRIRLETDYIFSIAFTFSDLAILFLFAFFLKEKIIKREKVGGLKPKRLDIFLFLFLSFVFISILFSEFQIVSFLVFLKLVRIVAIYYLIQKLFLDQRVRQFASLVLAATLVFQGFWASAQFALQGPLSRAIEVINATSSPYGYLASEEKSFFRAQGTFEHPNTLAAFLVIFLSFFLIQIFDPKRLVKIRKIFLVSFAVGFLGLMFSASRASWIILAIMAIAGVSFLKSQGKFTFSVFDRRWLITIFLLLTIFFPFLILPRMIHLYVTFDEFGGAYYRTYLLEKAWLVAQEAPLGTGLATFPAVLISKFGFFTWPAPVHNLFLQILSETGIFSLIFFLFFLTFSYKRFFMNLKKLDQSTFFLKIGAFLATLGFLGTAQFYPFFGATNIFEYFWIFLGIMLYPKYSGL